MFNISTNNVKNYLRANKSFVFYITSFIALNILCFSVRAYAYRKVFATFDDKYYYEKISTQVEPLQNRSDSGTAKIKVKPSQVQDLQGHPVENLYHQYLSLQALVQ